MGKTLAPELQHRGFAINRLSRNLFITINTVVNFISNTFQFKESFLAFANSIDSIKNLVKVGAKLLLQQRIVLDAFAAIRKHLNLYIKSMS